MAGPPVPLPESVVPAPPGGVPTGAAPPGRDAPDVCATTAPAHRHSTADSSRSTSPGGSSAVESLGANRQRGSYPAGLAGWEAASPYPVPGWWHSMPTEHPLSAPLEIGEYFGDQRLANIGCAQEECRTLFDASMAAQLACVFSLPEKAVGFGACDLPSEGSALHCKGWCKPCAFLYEGCQSGQNCKFCHLCPPGELKRRKRVRRAESRVQQLPSKGSSFHEKGLCKPCAFTYKGCANGLSCPFCHLCPPGEREMRRKARRAAGRAAQAFRVAGSMKPEQAVPPNIQWHRRDGL